MAYEGYVDFADESLVRGWVYDSANPDAPLPVEFLCGDTVVASGTADGFRADLLAAGKGSGWHAFSYQAGPVPMPGVLSARLAGKLWRLPSAGPLEGAPPPRFVRGLTHSLEFGWPSVSGGFTAAPSDPRLDLVERLLSAYHRAVRDDPNAPFAESDVWSQLTRLCHAEVVGFIRDRDVRALAACLADAHATNLTFGITQGLLTTAALRERADARLLELTRFQDYLASLAEYLGILDVESPEQHGRWAENFHESPDRLIASISAQIGIQVVPPPVIGSLFGIKTATGILSGRDLLSLFAALRLREVAAASSLVRPSVCEIGAGLGGAAFYAQKLGVGRYTIIDLPLVNMLQSYYLICALPGAKIRLYGEPPTADDELVILPTWTFNDSLPKSDLLFNCDSFPEMNRKYSVGYLTQARRTISHGFLSINQEAHAPQNPSESQPAVRDLVREAGGYARVSRNRHWLRPDYLDEFYAVQSG
jgi:hypothetical protein